MGRESIIGGRGGEAEVREKRQGGAGSWEVQLGSWGGVFPAPCPLLLFLPPKDQARIQDGGG